MISKHISQAQRVLPIGKSMADYFCEMEKDGIIFVRTFGCDVITLDYIDGYRYEIPKDALINYFGKHIQDTSVSQIVVIDKKKKNIIGITSVVGNRMWLPIIADEYSDMGIGITLTIIAMYESRKVTTLAVPYADLTAGAIVGLHMFLGKFGFKVLPEPLNDEIKEYMFIPSDTVIIFIRRSIDDICRDERGCKILIKDLKEVFNQV